jgi:hypothetical protein
MEAASLVSIILVGVPAISSLVANIFKTNQVLNTTKDVQGRLHLIESRLTRVEYVLDTIRKGAGYDPAPFELTPTDND